MVTQLESASVREPAGTVPQEPAHSADTGNPTLGELTMGATCISSPGARPAICYDGLRILRLDIHRTAFPTSTRTDQRA